MICSVVIDSQDLMLMRYDFGVTVMLWGSTNQAFYKIYIYARELALRWPLESHAEHNLLIQYMNLVSLIFFFCLFCLSLDIIVIRGVVYRFNGTSLV